MNPNTNRVLWLLVLLTGIAVWWDHNRGQPEAPSAGMESDLISGFHPESAMVIEVRNEGGILRAEKRGEEWRLTVPVDVPANNVLINNFLQGLTKLKKRVVLNADETGSTDRHLADFGLEPPKATLAVQRGNLRDELQIGNPTVMGDQVYIKLRGESQVMVTGRDLLNRFPVQPSEWRTRQLLNLDKVDYNRVSIRRPGKPLKPLEFTRSTPGGIWKITKPLEARANSPLVDSLIQKVLNTPIQGFVADYAGAQLESYGLDQPQAELAFGQGEVDLITLRFGPVSRDNADMCLVYRLPQENIILIEKSLLNDLQAPFVMFRNSRLMELDPERVKEVEVERGNSWSIKKSETDSTWKIESDRSFAADSSLVMHLISSIANLEIVEFHNDVVTDYSLYGLEPIKERIVLKGVAEPRSTEIKPLMELAFGTNLVDRVLVRRMDEKSVYAVDLGSYQRVSLEPFELRDRKIFNFGEGDVQKLVIREMGNEFVLERADSGSWKPGPVSQGIVEIEAVKETLRRLGQLKAENWVAKGEGRLEQFGIKPEAYTLVFHLLQDGQTLERSLVFGRLSPFKRPYSAVQIDGETHVFEFPSSLYSYVQSHLSIPVRPEPTAQ